MGVELIGYPLGGQAFGLGNVIKDYWMHRKSVDEPASGMFTPLNNYRIETATAIQGLPGNSGGPVYVVGLDSGSTYYPAGIYLGAGPQGSIVRAIDRDVAEQIQKAATAANVGTNQCSGDCVDPIGSARPAQVVRVSVSMEPPEIFGPGDTLVISTDAGGEPPVETSLRSFATHFQVGLKHTFHLPSVPGYVPTVSGLRLSQWVYEFTPTAADADLPLRFKFETLNAPILHWLPRTTGKPPRFEVLGMQNSSVIVEGARSLVEPWIPIGTVSLPVEGRAEIEWSPGDQNTWFFRASAKIP